MLICYKWCERRVQYVEGEKIFYPELASFAINSHTWLWHVSLFIEFFLIDAVKCISRRSYTEFFLLQISFLLLFFLVIHEESELICKIRSVHVKIVSFITWFHNFRFLHGFSNLGNWLSNVWGMVFGNSKGRLCF